MTEEQEVNCEIFQKQEVVIKEITDKINAAKDISEKASLAGEMRKEAEVLLACENYDDEKSDCRNCEFIADLRKKTADLIIKAKKLA